MPFLIDDNAVNSPRCPLPCTAMNMVQLVMGEPNYVPGVIPRLEPFLQRPLDNHSQPTLQQMNTERASHPTSFVGQMLPSVRTIGLSHR
jgi:hypothetical protein